MVNSLSASWRRLGLWLFWRGRFFGSRRIKARYTPKKPFAPLEIEFDQLIASSGKRIAALLQTLKDTGARIGEGCKIKKGRHRRSKTDHNNKRPRKRQQQPNRKSNRKNNSHAQNNKRKIPSIRLQPQPNAAQRSHGDREKQTCLPTAEPKIQADPPAYLQTLESNHGFAKTLNLPHVMKLLGRRSIQNTMIYMHLAKFECKEYETAYAATLNEKDELLKAGFDFIRFGEKEQLAVHRRRK